MMPNAHKMHWLQEAGLFPVVTESPGIDLMRQMAETTVEAWNKLYPIGSAVRCFTTYGDEKTAFETVTRSEAWLMNGHSAMVEIQGQTAPYALTHVKPLCGRAEVGGQANLITLKTCVAMVLQDLVGVQGAQTA